MKRYSKILVILLSVFAGFLSDNYSQTSSVEKNCFSSEEIAFDAASLPRNYKGNDLSLIITEIKRRESFTKTAFETNPQFRERIEREKSKSLIAELNYNSIFAFQIKDTNFQYNADKKAMKAELKLNSVFNWSPICQDKKGHSIVTPRQNLFAYLPIKNTLFTEPVDLSFKVEFEIEIEKAKKTKPILRTLLLTQLHAENGMHFSKGRYYTNSVLKISIQEIWIYDVVTGEIFVKKDSGDIAKLIKEKEDEHKEKRKRKVSKANSFYKNGQFKKAISELRKVLSSDPMNAEVYLLLGKIHFQRGEFEQTVSSLKTALFWDNNLIDAHIILGKIYLNKNNCGWAKTYLISALGIDNKNQEAIVLQKQVEKCNQ